MWRAVSKLSSNAASVATAATNSNEQDPAARRRVLHARYKLLRQLEAQVPATDAQQDEGDDSEEEDQGRGGGECWLSKVLAGSLTLAAAAFICYVLALHRQRLHALFE